MGDATEDLAKAAQLPEGDVIRILLEQHARIRELFEHVRSAEGEHKQQAFDELRALLAVHETAEEEIVHPLARRAVPSESDVEDRLTEERQAKELLSRLAPAAGAILPMQARGRTVGLLIIFLLNTTESDYE